MSLNGSRGDATPLPSTPPSSQYGDTMGPCTQPQGRGPHPRLAAGEPVGGGAGGVCHERLLIKHRGKTTRPTHKS